MSDYDQSFKDEFVSVISTQGIPIHTLSGKTLEASAIDPEDDKRQGCVPTAGKAFGTLSPRYRVVLSPEVSEIFKKIQLKAATINHKGSEEEIGFLMIGEENPDGTIEVNSINVHQIAYRGISYDENTTRKIDSIIDWAVRNGAQTGKKPFVIFGHTHPEQKRYPNFLANSWSLGDLWSSFCASERYKNNLQIADLLITPSLDTDLMFYDRDVKKFYRFAEGVCETDKHGNIETINNCYTDFNKQAIRLDPQTWDEDILTH